MKHKGFHIALCVLTVLLLALPAVQQYARLFKLRPLAGATVVTERPQLNVGTFMNGDFQKQEDRYLSEQVGFREVFIRSYNQVCWSLFRKVQNKTIYINDDNWIFNDFTIKHHYGQSGYDFGDTNEAVVEKMHASALMLRQLQELLKEYGVSFFVCLAPGKDMVCEEHLPEVEGFDRPPGVLAIDYFPPMFDSLGINYLNLSDYYLQIRDTVSYPLYYKSSSHWSNLAAAYVSDTLLHYMEHLSGLNLHDLRYSEPYQAFMRAPDADLESLLNLMYPIETDTYTYTTVTVDNDSTAVKPRWLIVGDSYYWGFQYNLPMNQLFDSYHYWYYNSTIHNDPLHNNVSQVDVLNELLSTDVVMLLYSPSNLYDLNRQFLTNALYNFYFDDASIKAKNEKIKQNIHNTTVWYAKIEDNAEKYGKTLEQSLDDEARYMLYNFPGYYFQEFKTAEVAACRNPRIDQVLSRLNDPERVPYRKEMLSNPEWLKAIREKAAASNITIEEAMERDIDWMLKNRH